MGYPFGHPCDLRQAGAGDTAGCAGLSVLHGKWLVYQFCAATTAARARRSSSSPFGLDPNLPDLACDALALACAARGWSLSQTRILLAAHGSARGPKAAEAAEAFATAMRDRLPGTTLATGYVEEDPRIATTARVFEDTAPARPSLCLPFFAQAGEHVRDDIPDALADAGFGGDTLPVLGALPQVPQLIANALNKALSGPGVTST
ncbi:sirohydrochlorin chelatase [Phaeobacter piscinae]|uniref:sirohydrochlorin chelatase n=1 Tax=Phaeobacter piscinae TaxID=1580596 RepID=UPI0039F6BD2D